MSPDQWDILAIYFEKAVELTPGEQEVIVQELRLQDELLADELYSLLGHAMAADPFMEELSAVVPSRGEEEPPPAGLNDPYEIVGTRISRYLVLDVIGGGGMGVIYRAEDTDLQRHVALKFLPPDLYKDEKAQERFITEARAASALDHPNVCTIYEVSRALDGRLFIVMGYYEGETLKKKIERGPLSEKECLDYTRQIALGLHAAHGQGIVHRDIKPGNIMVTKEGVVKILDFGIAKYADQHLTKTGTTIGTVAYMSPELIRGLTPKPTTDIWSLGVIMYEMVSGRRPFKGHRYEGIMFCVLNEEPRYKDDFPPDLPKYVKGIIQRCLQKDQRIRYGAVEELVDDIDENSTKSLPTIKLRQNLSRSRSSRWALGAGALGALLLAGVLLLQVFSVELGWKGEKEQRLVVLPFDSPEGDEESQVMAEGLMYTLASTLTYLDSPETPISVIPVSAVRRYGVQDAEDALKMLESNIALEGALSNIGGVMSLSLNLVEVNSLRVLGGDTRQFETGSAFNPLSPAYQEQMLTRFAEILEITLDQDKLAVFKDQFPSDPDAYAMYLQGVGYLQRFDKPGNIDFAIDLFNSALAIDSLYAPAHAGLCEALWEKYVHTFDEAFVDQALASCDRSAELGQSQAPVLIPLGSIFMRTGEYDRAEQSLRRAVELDPDNPEAFRWLGRLYFYKVEFDSARVNYQKAISLERNNWLYYYELGVALWEHGLFEEAATQHQFARQLSPDNYLPVYQLGVSRQMQGRIEEAEALMLEAIELNDDVPFVRRGLGMMYYREKRYQDAVDILSTAADAGDLLSLDFFAHSIYWSGNRSAADSTWNVLLEKAEAALRVSPRNRIARVTLIDAQTALGYYDDSLETINFLTGEERMDMWVAYFLCRAYELRGDRTQALFYMERALQQNFDVYMFENDPWLAELIQDAAYQDLKNQFSN